MRPRGDEISRLHQFRLRRGSRLASLVASPAPAPAPWAEWFRVDIGDDLDPGSRCQGRDARRDWGSARCGGTVVAALQPWTWWPTSLIFGPRVEHGGRSGASMARSVS